MNKKIILSLLVILALVSLFYIGQYLQRPPAVALAPAPVAMKPIPLSERPPSRCKTSRATEASLLLDGEPQWTKPLGDIVALPGNFILQNGRHKDSVALPVDAFLNGYDDVMVLELLACKGPPLRYLASELQTEKARYVLVINSHGMFKLIEREGDSYRTKPLLKNITQIRLLRVAGLAE